MITKLNKKGKSMKNKIVKKLFVVSVMTSILLVGCGGADNNETNPQETENTIEVETTGNNTVAYEYFTTYMFPEGVDGYTHKYTNDSRPDWSVNYTHFVDGNGLVSNLQWEGPVDLGFAANISSHMSTISLFDRHENYEMRIWACEVKDLEDALREYDK